MFRGISAATLDAKGRLALPTQFRELLRVVSDGKVVVTIDMREKCLLLYPLPEWEVVQRKLEALPNIGPQARQLQRLLIGHATDLEVDGHGRVRVGAMLRDYADLEKKLVLVGQGNKVEIWSETIWHSCMGDWLSDDSKELLASSDEFTGLSV